jgi:UDP-N-acetylglucosamine--N-acetylmuramyl-(pentapeptide) pyrophosphoryl-undecaprenol N-acetylglucosamine transferase
MNNLNKNIIAIAAGGTGGHFFPGLATANELIQHDYDVHIITDERCKKYFTNHSVEKYHIIDIKKNNVNFLTKCLFFLSLIRAIYRSIILLHNIKPKIIIGFGGYPSFPSMFAALILRIPIIIHEQNSFMGKVNKFLAKFAYKVTLTDKDTKNITGINNKKIIVIGNIIRDNIKKIKTKDNWDSDIFKILIFGGSQGAKIFSSLIPNTIKILLKSNPEIKLHIVQQIQQDDFEDVKKIYDNLNITYNLCDFFVNIHKEYDEANLVISRAGASTIAELTYIGMPSILIPYPHAADNHQLYNAINLQKKSASWYFVQNEVTSTKLAAKILLLIKNRDLLKSATTNLLNIRCDGSKTLVDIIEHTIK